MSDWIIKVENLGKKYRLQHQGEKQRYTALRDVIANKVKGLFQKRKAESGKRKSEEDFWALKDVSFEVKQGEVVGIIGRNGAGKSTLLKILSRITEPTKGSVRIRGRVASLLEVGTGFHPELTGRENVFLNGAILGMHRAEIRKKFDEIVAFAEVEKFLDTPVKRYSSGMYVRLAFAVAAHLEPEILIVDEVLAVGDAEFQKKCLGKMQEVSKGGRTVLFVSHNMAAVQTLCTSAIYLQMGTVKAVGEVDTLINEYQRNAKMGIASSQKLPLSIGAGLELSQLNFAPDIVESGGNLVFNIYLQAKINLRISELAILIYSAQGTRVAIIDLRNFGIPASFIAEQKWHATGEMKSLPLVEGDYSIGVYVNVDDFVGNLLDVTSLIVDLGRKNGYTPYAPAHRGFVELDFSRTFDPLS
jgi:lipopolysaccharide transport system ATP-binding protein